MNETVTLVDENDEDKGSCEKIEAHMTGTLHRAFSVFVFNSQGELLLQKRAKSKYHSKGLWSNTCCGHPRPGESTEAAAHRRLAEEMGFDCPLEEVFHFVYYTNLEDGLCEHEFNHVFIGRSEPEPRLDFDEAEDWKWTDIARLQNDIEDNPDNFTYWFRLSLNPVWHVYCDSYDLNRGPRVDDELELEFKA